jgi:hypothetical protein
MEENCKLKAPAAGPRAGLYRAEKRKISQPCREPYRIVCTDRSIWLLRKSRNMTTTFLMLPDGGDIF